MIIMIKLDDNGTFVSERRNGQLNCDFVCTGCVADGRCKAQNETMVNDRREICSYPNCNGCEGEGACELFDEIKRHEDEANRMDYGYEERETTEPDNAEVVDNKVFVDGEFVGRRCNNHDCMHFDFVEFDNSYGQPCGFQGCENDECTKATLIKIEKQNGFDLVIEETGQVMRQVENGEVTYKDESGIF